MSDIASTATIERAPFLSRDSETANQAALLVLRELANQPKPDPADLHALLAEIDDALTVVATDSSGNIVSTASLKTDEAHRGQVDYVATDHEQRGRNFGKAVLQKLEMIATEHDIRTLYLYPTITSEPFYLKLGYVDEGSAFTKQL